MENIANSVCHLVADLLADYDIRHIVTSPGSRNASLITVLERKGCFELHPVVDERTAAFIGLGMALRSGEPVALVCTSGTAVLNYAPALAEAFYRNVPLIAISADRPALWVDRLDCQTIRQYGALSAVVKASVDIPVAAAHEHQLFLLANLQLNEALNQAVDHNGGPVHINVQLDVPLTRLTTEPPLFTGRRIRTLTPSMRFSDPALAELAESLADKKIMVVAGGYTSDDDLNSIVSHLNAEDIVPVFAEVQANLDGAYRIAPIERTLREVGPEMLPDVVVTFGGSLVSGRLKQWLRSLRGVRHISLGPVDPMPDTFGLLSECVDCRPEVFLSVLSEISVDREFAHDWWCYYSDALQENDAEVEAQPLLHIFSQLAANSTGRDICISNGSAIRYAQRVGWHAARLDCNRGVSGIDGATSTAIGSAMVSDLPTILITGDMSVGYDIGALLNCDLPANFKIVILDNDGADIFRNISTTNRLRECNEFFVLPHRLPYFEICDFIGGKFYEIAVGEDAPEDVIADFFTESGPAMLVLKINPEISKDLL